MRKRAGDATFPVSSSSSKTSLRDSTFTEGKPIYVHESHGTLHPRVSVFSPLLWLQEQARRDIRFKI
jgi:hypothetical protein